MMKKLVLLLVICLCFSIVAIANEICGADISEYTESDFYHVEKIIPTEYGTVLYFWPVGTPHGGKNPGLILIREDGSKINLSEPISFIILSMKILRCKMMEKL